MSESCTRLEIADEVRALGTEEKHAIRSVLEPVGAWHALTLPSLLDAIDPADPRSLYLRLATLFLRSIARSAARAQEGVSRAFIVLVFLIVLRVIEDLSFPEITERIGTDARAARGLYARALRELQRALTGGKSLT